MAHFSYHMPIRSFKYKEFTNEIHFGPEGHLYRIMTLVLPKGRPNYIIHVGDLT